MRMFEHYSFRVLLILAGVMAFPAAWSSSQVPPASPVGQVLAGSGAEADLRHALGNAYPVFARNFQVTAEPVLLKDGGLFLDGWRDGAPEAHAAAFVHYADGRTYAAYYDSERGEVVYAGPSPVHPALRIWAQRFGPAIHVLPPAESSAARAVEPYALTPADTPGATDQEELRKVATSIWGAGLASGWDMNAEVGEILGTVTQEITQCSAAFSLVPKPVGWVPGWGYVAKSAYAIVAYITGVSKDRVYKVCVSSAALNWRSAVELASAGI